MQNKQDSFMFYENFLEAIDQLPESERANACYQLCKYALNDELPEDKSLAMFCIGVKYSVHKYQGRGGARIGAGRPKKTTEEENQKNQNIQKNQNTQTETETKTENININNNINISRAKEENKARVHNALEVFGNAFRATDAVVGIFDRPDGTQREGIQIKNPRLMAFVRHRFDKRTLEKVSDWAIDHNQRGHTYNASALLKLMCKFQSNIEPAINYNGVQAEYLTFEYQEPKRKEA